MYWLFLAYILTLKHDIVILKKDFQITKSVDVPDTDF